MAKEKKINLDIVEFFSAKHPKINVKKPRWAVLGIVDEFRRLDVGGVVLFPIGKYKYSSIRSTPASALVEERMDGKEWTTRIDKPNKSIAVMRVS